MKERMNSYMDKAREWEARRNNIDRLLDSNKTVADQARKDNFRDMYRNASSGLQQMADLIAYRLYNDPKFTKLNLATENNLNTVSQLKKAFNVLSSGKAQEQESNEAKKIFTQKGINPPAEDIDSLINSVKSLPSFKGKYWDDPGVNGYGGYEKLLKGDPTRAHTHSKGDQIFIGSTLRTDPNDFITDFIHEGGHQSDNKSDRSSESINNINRAIEKLSNRGNSVFNKINNRTIMNGIADIIGDRELCYRVDDTLAENIGHMTPTFHNRWIHPQMFADSNIDYVLDLDKKDDNTDNYIQYIDGIRKIARKIAKTSFNNLTNDDSFFNKLPKKPVLDNGSQTFEDFKYNSKLIPKYNYGPFEPTIQNIRDKIDFLSYINKPLRLYDIDISDNPQSLNTSFFTSPTMTMTKFKKLLSKPEKNKKQLFNSINIPIGMTGQNMINPRFGDNYQELAQGGIVTVPRRNSEGFIHKKYIQSQPISLLDYLQKGKSVERNRSSSLNVDNLLRYLLR